MLAEYCDYNQPQLSLESGSFCYNTCAGIEVEVEGYEGSWDDLNYWRVTEDGSLRNRGAEFVLREPLSGAILEAAFEELDQHLNLVSHDLSWRCSTHVHLDARDMSIEQLQKFMLVYLTVEPHLFEIFGNSRYYSNFCLPLGFAEDQLLDLAKAFCGSWDDFRNTMVWSKYSALNLLPLWEWGSIEFRGAEPKFSREKLFRITNALFSMKKIAMSFEGTNSDLLNSLCSTDPFDILQVSYNYEPALHEKGLAAARSIPILMKVVEAEMEAHRHHREQQRQYAILEEEYHTARWRVIRTKARSQLQREVSPRVNCSRIWDILSHEGKEGSWQAYIWQADHEKFQNFLAKREALLNFQF